MGEAYPHEEERGREEKRWMDRKQLTPNTEWMEQGQY